MPGTLFIVATPIGNLEDITLRALRILRGVDLIACEDTRHSRKLLAHFSIDRPVVSCYRENEAQRTPELIERLRAGADVALISDAGAPAIADPGSRLVAAAIAAGIAVVPVPGASAPVAALMGAGDVPLPWCFLGFLPARAGERRATLELWRAFPGTLVAFEAPHRLAAALADVESVMGPERSLVIARELTKLHEQFLRGTAASLRGGIGADGMRGECTLLVLPAAPGAAVPAADDVDRRLHSLGADAAGKAALKALAKELGLPRAELYRRWQQMRGRINK